MSIVEPSKIFFFLKSFRKSESNQTLNNCHQRWLLFGSFTVVSPVFSETSPSTP